MLYTSIENKKIKSIKKLNDKKYRDIDNIFLIEGEHLILEAKKNNILESVIALEGYELNVDFDIDYASLNVLKYITNLNTPPKVIGVCRKIKSRDIKGNVVVLDGIQDPGNLGTIIRSCVAFNIDTLLLSKNTVDLYNPKVVRATQGMLFNINIVVCDIKEEIQKLKENGYYVFGTDVNNGKTLKSIEKKSQFVIIMGNEGNGMSDEIKTICDDFLYIDMNKNCESLNVGVATSIILYELDK